ncbi:HEAT repeat domain-containing protein [Haliangium ochraceum]|uniref:PBS lyase HEAT domain protein repeat-containing protein n=1 Tax=Haliangium ochraceum (strain DSM 14365 / JCM 11303 / SMP-2) TaxID=502025 RepID=D0LX50_HALO1|nr:HEAT repeat domain-containing protein [Haliangium ochraceum]ACY16092.1 hypothetical protein Hoch_3590 [Haliangium ochraceum DSM 14365]
MVPLASLTPLARTAAAAEAPPPPVVGPRRVGLALVALLALSAIAACAPPAVGQARTLLERGDYAGAASVASTGLDAHPDEDELWRLRVEATLAGGDASAALALYREYADGRGEHDRDLLHRLAKRTLAQGLRVPSAQVRAASVAAIERREIISLAQAVAARMDDEDDAVAAAAAIALLNSAPGARQLAAQLLRSRDPVARARVLAGIARKLGAPTRGEQRAALGDPDAEVRRTAVRALADMLTADDVAALTALAAEEPAPAVRAAALRALRTRAGRSEDRAALAAAAARGLADEHISARRAALDLLIALAAKAEGASENQAEAALAELAARAEPALAVPAATALRDAQPALLEQAVTRALADDDASVRALAVGAAHRLPDARARELARASLTDPEPGVRAAAAGALLYLADLEARAQDERQALREQAGDALRALLASPALAERAHLRLRVAVDLYILGDAAAAAALRELFAAADAGVRQAAVDAYRSVRQRRGGVAPELTHALAQALADPAPLVRVRAAERLLEG